MVAWRLIQGRGEGVGEAEALILAGLGWSVGVAVAAELPLAGFVLAGLWLGWHGLSLMTPWAGTPVMVLPLAWLVLVALLVLVWRGPRRKWIGWGLWGAVSLGSGYLAADPVGWNGWLGLTGNLAWVGRFLAGVGVGLLGAALRPALRAGAWSEPDFGKVLAGSLVVMGSGVGLAGWRDIAGAAGGAWETLRALGSWAGPGWFLLAGGFAGRLLEMAEWGSVELVRGLRWRRARWGLPGLWAGMTLLEWGSTHGGSLPQVGLVTALARWSAAWPFDLKMVVWTHAWVGVVILVLAGGVGGPGRAGLRWWPRLNALWVAALVGLVAGAGALAGRVEANDAAQSARWWPVLVLLGGGGWIFQRLVHAWDGADPEAGGWKATRQVRRTLGMLVILSGALLAVEWTSDTGWVSRGGAVALLGMLHFGLPVALHRWWGRSGGAGGNPGVATFVWLILGGMASALIVLNMDAQKSSLLGICPVVWAAVLIWLRVQEPRLGMATGMLAGALVAGVTVAAWCRPGVLLPEIPLIPWLNAPSEAQEGGRPFMDLPYFMLSGMMGTVGALLGGLIFRPMQGPGHPLIPIFDVSRGHGAPVSGGNWKQPE